LKTNQFVKLIWIGIQFSGFPGDKLAKACVDPCLVPRTYSR